MRLAPREERFSVSTSHSKYALPFFSGSRPS